MATKAINTLSESGFCSAVFFVWLICMRSSPWRNKEMEATVDVGLNRSQSSCEEVRVEGELHHPRHHQPISQVITASMWMKSSWVVERLSANAVVATVLGSIPASSDTVESEGRKMKPCWISYIKEKIPKIPPLSIYYSKLLRTTCVLVSTCYFHPLNPFQNKKNMRPWLLCCRHPFLPSTWWGKLYLQHREKKD